MVALAERVNLTTLNLKAQNTKAIEAVVAIQNKLEASKIDEREGEIKKQADRTLLGLGIMTWAAFVLGLVLIGTSLALFIIQGKSLDVLGMGTIGLGDLVAILLYKPIDKLQESDLKFAQQLLVIRGWAMTVNLQLFAMDLNDAESVRKTADAIQSATEEYGKILSAMVPSASTSGSSSTSGPGAPGAGQKASPAVDQPS